MSQPPNTTTPGAVPAPPPRSGAGAGTALALGVLGLFIWLVAPFAVVTAWRARGSGQATAALVLGVLGTVALVVAVVSLAVNGIDFHSGS